MSMKTNVSKPAARGARKAITLAIVTLSIAAMAMALYACSPQANSSTSTASTVSSSDGATVYAVTEAAVATTDEQPTMDKHEAFNVDCVQCHGTDDPVSAPESDETCLSCHDYDALVASTADLEDIPNRQVNPHDNHMHGTSCMSCHSNHGESTVACNDCHVNEYTWMVP